ncbi:MAG: hypothetical protein LBL58_11305 [Tannerellaceae bacterium]|jgi:hypothetical protein|nr:hypothetical protein [Tannerellaceae bacterium]
MNYLLFLNISLLLCITSCSPSITKGLRKEEQRTVYREQLPPLVDASSRLRKYNMTIDVMKRHFSGLLLIKQTGNNTYRTLFSAHFGLSVFDFEVTADSIHVYHCIEPLQKKKLLSLLHKDFSVLFGLDRKLNTRQIESIQTGKGLGKRRFTMEGDTISIYHTFPKLKIRLEPLL